jgi:hypothetical protein
MWLMNYYLSWWLRPGATYLQGVPDYADTVEKDGSPVVTVAKPVEGRDKRRVRLTEAKK